MAESSLSRLPLLGKVLIGALLLGVVGAMYLLTVFSDLAESIQSEERRETELRKDLAEVRKAELAYQQDMADLAELEERKKALNKILPATPEHAAFLSSVQSVAHASGVDLIAWTPQEEVLEKFYAKIPMRLEFRGRYHQIAKFFYGIGQLDRIINMENIALTEPTVQAEEVNVQVEALATAFRAAETAGAAGDSADKRGNAIQRRQAAEEQR